MEKSKRPENEISDYDIDHRLKAGKDFPIELLPLTLYFREKKHPLFGFVRADPKAPPISSSPTLLSPDKLKKDKRLTGIFQKQITNAERAFRDYFFNERRATNKIPLRAYWAKKINAHLNRVRPQLFFDGQGGHKIDLAVTAEINIVGMDVWVLLAQVIDSKDGHGLKPKLVHQCLYCEKIFISRQRKKYHPNCKPKFLSEKAVREGKARERQKLYRQRKKKKSRVKKNR